MKRFASLLTLATLLLPCAGLPLHAQEGPKTVSGKWRPKDGTYAKPGPEFGARCGEYGDMQVDWNSNFISGGEEGCKIVKLSDTAPGSIRLDTVCHSAEREGHPYKEITLLKKIDEKTIFVRETQDGKFRRPGGPMAYCPDDAQSLYSASKKKS
jgi:hypothetical protein